MSDVENRVKKSFFTSSFNTWAPNDQQDFADDWVHFEEKAASLSLKQLFFLVIFWLYYGNNTNNTCN